MEQARPDSTVLPAAQIEAGHISDGSHDADERITRLLTTRSSVPLPEPGSEEAKSAFNAACHEHSIRTQFANEYPELKRTPLECWTAHSLGKALETGELKPAECARLYPLATERELRMAQIEHELNVGGLFTLAYADHYPVAMANRDANQIESSRGEDAELLRLGRQFEAAREREIAACEACNAAQREANRHMPERPTALLFRASDHPLRLRKFLTHPDSLEGEEVTADDIAWMKRKPYVREVRRPVRPDDNLPANARTVVDTHPWPEAQERADEIVCAWDAWHAERLRIHGEYVTAALDDAANEAGDAAVALAERIAALPAHTAEGFRVKLRALSHYRRNALLAEVTEDPDLDQLLSHSLWRDVQAEPMPPSIPAGPTNLIDQIDFASASLEDLQALHDIANTVADVASAMAWTGRCHSRGWNEKSNPGDYYNAAGKLMQWLGDALTDVESAANREAKRRRPTTPCDRETRLEMLALPVIQNGDADETAAFARELADHAAAEARGA